MLFVVIKHLIDTKRYEGLSEKLDVLYLAGRLTRAEYEELVESLKGKEG